MASQTDLRVSRFDGPTRRDFLHASSAAMIATVAASGTALAAKKETLRVGLIGCGGRGTGAARQALNADPDAVLYAMADVFEDQLESSFAKLSESGVGDRVRVKEKRKYVGFDAYQGVIDTCDVVLLTTPPAFRPLHLEAAVEAGKHLFVEKPIAVDAPGVRSVMASCRSARGKGINVVSGLCYRYEFAKRATMQRVHDGEIGDILALQATYNTGALWHKGRKPAWSELEFQMRNWLYFDWLSGDHINEQHIHSLDKLAWAMDGYPVKATSSGGRIVRTGAEYGNVYDHFNTVYEWSNGIKGFSSCRQWANAQTDVSDHVFGSKGTAHLQQHRIDRHDGSVWQHRKDPSDDMYQNEHDALFAAIRSGEPINDGEIMCNSTLMAIMGRMSAYTGRTVTWDEALHSKLDLTPSGYERGVVSVPEVSRPGITKFV